MGSSGAAGSGSAYGTPRIGGSVPAGTEEVWLRGNVRPVLVGGGLIVGGLTLALLAAVALGASAVVAGVLAAVVLLALGIVVVLGRAAGGSRVGRRGDALLVRLSWWRTEAVPLGVVECVFPGSQPLDGPVLRHVHGSESEEEARAPSGRRVGTLVIRFAERATEWRERPTFAPWGTWHDGHAIVDGRWCEPLSAETARAIGQRLQEAKRAPGPARGS